MQKRRLLLRACQAAGFLEQRLIENYCRSHMHKYGY